MAKSNQPKVEKPKSIAALFALSPLEFVLIFSMVLLIAAGASAYYVQSNLAPGQPSPFTSKCNMWNRCS